MKLTIFKYVLLLTITKHLSGNPVLEITSFTGICQGC